MNDTRRALPSSCPDVKNSSEESRLRKPEPSACAFFRIERGRGAYLPGYGCDGWYGYALLKREHTENRNPGSCNGTPRTKATASYFSGFTRFWSA
ncbi:MAG: hypothetical protein MZV70_33335 [Desulfobacterales bacterium]|nr:hypothetical protein [Desulfobacterales bacterium]